MSDHLPSPRLPSPRLDRCDHACWWRIECNLLESRGFQVVGTAETAGKGLNSVAAGTRTWCLMDIRMPRCDGLAAPG